LEHVDVTANSVTILDGKGNKDRVVPMTSEAIYWIKRWRSRRQQLIENADDPGWLFITKGKVPITRRVFSTMLKGFAKKANIPLDVSPHDLRRTTATHLVENGAPIRQVQSLLGHSSLKVTTKYLRLSDEKIREEYAATHPANKRRLHYGSVKT
jgi:integrase/recombinase XerD